MLWLPPISESSWRELRGIFDFTIVLSLSFSHHPFPVWSAGNPRLLILLERKPRKVSDWSQLSSAGAALHSFRGVAQPTHAAGGRTQPHRGPLCSGPYRWMTFFFHSPPTLIPKRNGKTKQNKKNERNSYYYYYYTIFFLKDCCILRKDQKPCCLKESPPVRARGQQWIFPPASPPFPPASAPRTCQRKETLHLQLSHCPGWRRGPSH